MAARPLAHHDIDIEVTATEASMIGSELRSCLEGELWPAVVAARRIDALEKLGIAATLQTLTGIAFAEFFSPCYYQPDQGGVPVVVVGAVYDGDLADLVAIEIEGRRVGSRFGAAALLGADLVDHARWHRLAVKLVTPRQWLGNPAGSVAVVDWSRAAWALQDLDMLHLDSPRLARRVARAFKQPVRRPRLMLPD